ncbi:hypothetical protein ACQ4M3_13940 [Leptolyngbya sp. AN03gr2]
MPSILKTNEIFAPEERKETRRRVEAIAQGKSRAKQFQKLWQ